MLHCVPDRCSLHFCQRLRRMNYFRSARTKIWYENKKLSKSNHKRFPTSNTLCAKPSSCRPKTLTKRTLSQVASPSLSKNILMNAFLSRGEARDCGFSGEASWWILSRMPLTSKQESSSKNRSDDHMLA